MLSENWQDRKRYFLWIYIKKRKLAKNCPHQVGSPSTWYIGTQDNLKLSLTYRSSGLLGSWGGGDVWWKRLRRGTQFCVRQVWFNIWNMTFCKLNVSKLRIFGNPGYFETFTLYESWCRSGRHTSGVLSIVWWAPQYRINVWWSTSGVATGGSRGQSAHQQRKICQKLGKRGKKSGKGENLEEKAKIGKVLSLCPLWQIELAMLLWSSQYTLLYYVSLLVLRHSNT